jgi:hypothetical protein
LGCSAPDDAQPRARVTEPEGRVGREPHRIAIELLDAEGTRPGVRETVQGYLDMTAAWACPTSSPTTPPPRARVVAQWAALRETALR